MTEKLTIVLTDHDVNDAPISSDEWGVKYSSKCPFCAQTILVTRIKGACCKCDIEWRLDLKIKGVRSYSDEDRKQPSLPFITTA